MSCKGVSREEVEAQTSSLKDAVSGLFLVCQQILDGSLLPRSQAQEASQETMAVLVSQISATLDLCKRCGAPSTRKRQLQKEIEEIETELEEKVGVYLHMLSILLSPVQHCNRRGHELGLCPV